VLRRVDTGEEKLDRIIPYTEADIEPTYSPVTKDHAGVARRSVMLLRLAWISTEANHPNAER